MIAAKGTGITVYNVIRTQMNCSFILDGGSSSAFVYPYDPRCYQRNVNGPWGCYNSSFYNAQSLTYGAHTLNITLLTYLGSQNFIGGLTASTDFWFDYALISSTSSSSSPGNIGPSNQQSQCVSLPPCGSEWLTSRSKLPAVVIGGAVGGVVIVSAVVLAALYYRKRGYRQQRPHTEVDPEPVRSSFQPTTLITNPPLNRDALHTWSPTRLLPEDPNFQITNILPSPMPPTSSISSTTAYVPTSPATSSPTSARLTEEQSELVQSLIRQKIPLPAVVGVMEGMLRREGPSVGGEGSGSQISQTDGSLEPDDPPDYDFI
jgi:hypothetical protein